jgi:hypothetical protein
MGSGDVLDETRGKEGAQLDHGIGDTLVSVYAAGSHLEALRMLLFRRLECETPLST